MILTASQIRGLRDKKQLVSGYLDFDVQLQPVGFDVTLASVKRLPDTTVTISEAKTVWKTLKEWPFDRPLESGKSYVFTTNESIKLPPDITAFAFPRSSLTRLGALLSSGIIDPGYEGQLSFSVYAGVNLKVSKGDRFSQIVFMRHKKTVAYAGQYGVKS